MDDPQAVLGWINLHSSHQQMGASAGGWTENSTGGLYRRGEELDAAQYSRFLFLLKASRMVGSPRPLTPREVGTIMGRSLGWVKKMLTRIDNIGVCGALGNRGGQKAACTKIGNVERAALLDIVRRWPHFTLAAIQNELFLHTFTVVHTSNIYRTLCSMGLTKNVRGVIATQRAAAQVQQYNAQFRARVAGLDPDLCSWFDSAQVCKRDGSVRSRKAWCVVGGRVTIPKPFIRSPTSVMMNAVLTTAGMICVEMEDGHIDSDWMRQYFSRVAPVLSASGFRYFILDNAPVHDVIIISTIFNWFGITVLFLPPCVVRHVHTQRACAADSAFTLPHRHVTPSPPLLPLVQVHARDEPHRDGLAIHQRSTVQTPRRAPRRSAR
jgi:transposase